MFWLKCVAVCAALLGVHCYIPYSSNQCTEEHEDIYIFPNYGGGDPPKPPEIGHSYIAKYEMSSIDANHPAWVEEYFDYEGKRAKISASVLGVEFVDIYDYGKGTVTSYRLSRAESSGWSSKIEDTCETVEMTKFKPASPILSYPYSRKAKSGPQPMATSNRALKYGPPYNYTYLENYIGKENRNIQSDIFRGCINEEHLNYSLRSNFYWGRALPFSYPSGEERVPLYIEMRGPDLKNKGKEIDMTMYVSWFQNDPEFSSDTFQVPKGLHCKYSPNRGRLPNIPSSFSYGVEETAFQLDGSGFLKAGFASLSYKKATIMGAEAETWTELVKGAGKSSIIKRDISFSSYDARKDKYSNKYVFSLLQEAVYEEEDTQQKHSGEFPNQNVIIRNYLYFNSFAPNQDAFSQHACLPEKPSGSYYINFKPLKGCTLDAGNRTRFLAAFRKVLTTSTKLSTILTVQNFHFRWYNRNGTSVGFTFHEGILGEKSNESKFSTIAKQKAEADQQSLTVSFRLTAASEMDECTWQSYLFHKQQLTVFQPSTTPSPDMAF